jgi:hypothetical protein
VHTDSKRSESMPDNYRKTRLSPIFSGLLFAAISIPSFAQSNSAQAPLFAEQAALPIRISGPISTLMKERSDTEYLDGTLSFSDDSGELHELGLRFRARGNYRRKKSTCWFPPVRLNFKKKETKGTVFEGQNILKIVTHCSPTSKRSEQYILKEYLAYKILELHTPYSFKTRLLKTTWVDTDKDNKKAEKYGFVIEHKDDVAKRNESKVAGITSTRHSNLDIRQASIVSVFEYLIGNTDFSLVKAIAGASCCHNGILVSKDEEKYFPIPYDFDFAGIVNAPYAEPSPNFSINSVTQRLYRGNCSVNAELATTLTLFQENKEAVLELITSQEGLNDKERKRTLKFVNKFYNELAKPEKLEAKFVKRCVGR